MTRGLRLAGFGVVGAIELDELAAETYRKNHQGTRVWQKDIRRVTVAEVQRELGLKKYELDLLAGCPPCQGFSTLRTLNGNRRVHDDRNDLVLEFERFVRVLRPRTVMLENVPGLAEDLRLAQLMTTLDECGYRVTVGVLDAAEFGVPQRRKRMILVAGRGVEIPFAAAAKRRTTVRDAIGGLKPSGKSGDDVHDFPEQRSQRIRELIVQIPKDGGSRSDLPRQYALECHERCDGFNDVYGRMAWDDVAPTITSGCVNPSKGRFLHPQENRTMTIREAALLQSFSKRYKFPSHRGKFPLAEMIGNAIPPEFIRRHALGIKRHVQAHWG